jgi:hypothetical protein
MFTLDPTVVNAMMLGVVALTNALAAWITNRLATRRSDATAVTLAKNNAVQGQKIDSVAATTNQTHILVNSQMGEVLKTLVASALALHDARPTPANKALLDEAKDKLMQHDSRQRTADSIRRFSKP